VIFGGDEAGKSVNALAFPYVASCPVCANCRSEKKEANHHHFLTLLSEPHQQIRRQNDKTRLATLSLLFGEIEPASLLCHSLA
jgi:hypothetical protein